MYFILFFVQISNKYFNNNFGGKKKNLKLIVLDFLDVIKY